MIGSIPPLTKIQGVDREGHYVVLCRDCGDVTIEESNFTVEAGGVAIQQAGLYQQRHLSRHLTALAHEVAEATR